MCFALFEKKTNKIVDFFASTYKKWEKMGTIFCFPIFCNYCCEVKFCLPTKKNNFV